MAKTKEQKKEDLKSLEDKFNKTKSTVFVNFSGLNVKETTGLRKSLRKEGIDYEVVKKTLLKLALDKTGHEDVDPKKLEGNVATVFGYEDEVLPAKILSEFRGQNKALEILGGIIEKKYIASAKVGELASIPGKKELLAKVVGSINAPVSGFVNVLAGNLRGLVQVLKAMSEKSA